MVVKTLFIHLVRVRDIHFFPLKLCDTVLCSYLYKTSRTEDFSYDIHKKNKETEHRRDQDICEQMKVKFTRMQISYIRQR